MKKSNIKLNKEDILSNLFDSTFIAVIIVDKSRNNILVNDRMCEMFGYSKEEILSTDVRIFHVDETHYKEFGEIAFNHVLQKKPLSINYEFKKKDGTKFWAKISGDPIKDKNFVLWTIIDVDESIKSKNYLQSIIDNFPFLIWLKDINSKFLMANKNVLDATKLKSYEEIQGKSDLELFPEKNAKKYLQDDKKVIKSKKPLNKEELLDIDGKDNWIHTYKAPIVDENNQVTGTVGFAREISQDKELEDNLKSVSERLTLALEGTHDGLWDLNLETNELYLSPGYKKMLGYEDNELKNEFGTWEKLVHPKYLDYCWDYFNKHLQSDEEYFELNFEMKHKDGHFVPILSRAKKVFDEKSNAVRLVGTHVDMTEIYDIQNKLMEKTELFKTLIDEIPYPVVLKNYDAKFILVNKATAILYGSTPDEMIGKDDGDYIPDKILANQFRKNVKEIMDKDETTIVYEDSIDVETNKTRNYMSIKKPFTNKDGKKFILVLANDITELNEKNRKIADAEKLLNQQSKMAAMGEMIANIAHQWRQPLSIITTAATGLMIQKENNMLNDEILKMTLSKINETSQYLSKTIDDFRNFFRQDKNFEECEIEEIWENALNFIYLRIKNNEIEIIEEFNASKIQSFRNELIQVFINIINNSIDAVKDKNTKRYIKITTFDDEDEIVIKICDNGGGIDKEIISKIFEPYFTTKHKSQGTGIGLYMTEEIVVKHLNGQIDVENIEFEENENKYTGAEFRITLPI